MKTILKKIIFIFLLVLPFNDRTALAVTIHSLTDYHQTFFPCYNEKNELRIVIRTYYIDNTLYYLVVNPHTFATEAAPAIHFKHRKIMSNTPGYFTMKNLLATPYMQALMKYTSPPYILQNQGIQHAEKLVQGMFLTVDMCPSVKPFEKKFFNALVKLAETKQQPIPIAISITGLWIMGHPEEFNWLVKEINEHKLKIIWVNHSFSHVYYSDLPLEKNFLLALNINTTQEILATEKLLLERGQLPSVYFRFPGLISNKKLILKLQKYGLIPLGTDAWLAKNETPKPGSIILVHGNSNEPQGIKKIMPLLYNPSFQWLSLNEAFAVGTSR